MMRRSKILIKRRENRRRRRTKKRKTIRRRKGRRIITRSTRSKNVNYAPKRILSKQIAYVNCKTENAK